MRKITALILVVLFLIPCVVNGEEIKTYSGNDGFYSNIRKISFADMAYKPVDHWSKDAVYTVAALSVMNGSDGDFMPDENLTKAEALAMISRAAGLEKIANSYSETVRKQKIAQPDKYNNMSSWADGYLRLAVDYKILGVDEYTAEMAADYSKATFKRDNPATKGEVARWMVAVFELEVATKENYVTEFEDALNAPYMDRLYYETAIKNGILKGDGKNLGVLKYITREEAAQMFYNSIKLFKDKLGVEVFTDTVLSNTLTSINETDKIHNKRVVSLEKSSLQATRTYDLNGEAVDLNYNPENEYKDMVVVKHNSLPQGLEALSQGDIVDVYTKNGEVVLINCLQKKKQAEIRNEADYKDSDVYIGKLYYVDSEEKMVVIKDKDDKFVEIPYLEDVHLCNREKELTVDEANAMWSDKDVYVFTIVKINGTVNRAYRIQLVDKGE